MRLPLYSFSPNMYLPREIVGSSFFLSSFFFFFFSEIIDTEHVLLPKRKVFGTRDNSLSNVHIDTRGVRI